jgi:molybdenum cofactor biosynthesis protein B
LTCDDIQVVIVNGGTGIAARDGTYEVVSAMLEKRLDGFGEIFRFLSFQEIGSAAIMSRAVAGVAKGKAIFSLPGSRGAVDLAMRRLILPELGHLAAQLQGYGSKG